MRIRGLHVDGFGHFHDLHIDDLPPGLVLLHGPNEAGKSTLLEFLLFVLFGTETRARKPSALAGGRVGGRLTLDLADGPATLERFERAVLHSDRTTIDGDDAVRQRLGGIDRATYKAMFAFGLGDLSGLDKLGDDDVRERLFSGALVGAGRSVKSARAELRKRIDALWRPRAASLVGDLDAELRQLDAGLTLARAQVLQLQPLEAELHRRATATEAARQRADAARREQQRFDGLLRGSTHHAAWQEKTAALMELPPPRAVSVDLRNELHTLRLAEAEARNQVETWAKPLGEAREEANANAGGAAIVAMRASVAALSEGVDAAPDVALREAATQREGAADRLTTALRDLGIEDAARLRTIVLTPSQVSELRDAATAARASAAVEAAILEAESHVDVAQRASEEALAERDRVVVDEGAEAVAGEVDLLRRDEGRVTAAQSRVDELVSRLTSLAAQRVRAVDDLSGEPQASGIVTDLRTREALRNEVATWRASLHRAESVAELARGVEERAAEARTVAQGEVAKGEVAKVPSAVSGAVGQAMDLAGDSALSDTGVRSLESKVDAAIAAGLQAEGAETQADRRRARLKQLYADLQAPGLRAGSFAAIVGARVVLDRAARTLQDTTQTREHAEQALATRREELPTGDLSAADATADAAARAAASAAADKPATDRPVNAPSPPDIDTLQRRLIAIAEADAAVRERDDARQRAGSTGGPPPWARYAAVGIAIALVLIGVAAIASGSAPLGLLVVLLALVVAIGGWTLLRPVAAAGGEGTAGKGIAGEATAGGGTAGGGPTGMATREQAAARALATAGLPGDAGVTALARARAELEAQRGQAERAQMRSEQSAERRQAVQRAMDQVASTRSAEQHARRGWHTALTAVGLPTSIEPDALDTLMARLTALLEGMREIEHLEGDRRDRLATWSAWCAQAAIVARGVGRTPPSTPEEARALMAALAEHTRSVAQAHLQRERQTETARRAELDWTEAGRLRKDAEKASETIVIREVGLRQTATRAGVPDTVALDGAADWLGRVGELRTLEEQRATAASEMAQLQAEVSGWSARLEDVRTKLGLGAVGLAELATRCAAALEKRSVWRRLDEEHQLRRRGLDDTKRRLSDVTVRADQTRRACAQWEAAREGAGLPRTRPEDLDGLLTTLDRARAAADDLTRIDGQLLAARVRVDALMASATDIAALAGRPLPTGVDDARRLARDLATEISLAQESLHRRDAALARITTLDARIESSRDTLLSTTARIEALLSGADVETDAALDAALRGEERRRTLQAELDAARVALREALGPYAEDAETVRALEEGDRAAWQTGHEEARRDLADAERTRDDAIEARTRIDQEIHALLDSTTIPVLEARRAVVLADLDRRRRELAEVVLADALLDRTLARFREAHQPAVLRIASGYLDRATAGRYTTVTATEDGRDLIVIDAAGGRRTTAQLSRGTTELLYIVLRLGLAADGATRGLWMPLVLDDILVNLDPERANGVAQLLAYVAQSHQVLVLTCRPETRDLLVEHAPGARVVDLPRYAGRVGPVAGQGGGLATRGASGGAPDPAADAILRVLEAAGGEPLGRADLIARAGIAEAAWASGIARLRELGLVEMEGNKRGATYRARG